MERPWTDEEISLIGTASDYEVGRKLGRPQSCIHAKRLRLGIPSFIVRWSKAELALLGADTDKNIARLLDRTEHAVKNQRKKFKIAAYR